MLDLQHPHSAHMLRAARHLDALRALGLQFAHGKQPHVARAAAAEVAALAQLSAAEFARTQASAQTQLRRVAAYFDLLPETSAATDRPAELTAALAQLEQDFGTWAI